MSIDEAQEIIGKVDILLFFALFFLVSVIKIYRDKNDLKNLSPKEDWLLSFGIVTHATIIIYAICLIFQVAFLSIISLK